MHIKRVVTTVLIAVGLGVIAAPAIATADTPRMTYDSICRAVSCMTYN